MTLHIPHLRVQFANNGSKLVLVSGLLMIEPEYPLLHDKQQSIDALVVSLLLVPGCET